MSNFTKGIRSYSLDSTRSLAQKKEQIASLLKFLQEPSRIKESRIVQIQMSQWEHYQIQYTASQNRDTQLKARLEEMRTQYNYGGQLARLEGIRETQQIFRQNLENTLNTLMPAIQVVHQIIRNITRPQLAQLKSYRRPHQIIKNVFRALAILTKYQFLKPFPIDTRFTHKTLNQLPQIVCTIDIFKIDRSDISQAASILTGLSSSQVNLIDSVTGKIFTWLRFYITVHPVCEQIKSVQLQMSEMNLNIQENTQEIHEQQLRINDFIEECATFQKELGALSVAMAIEQSKMENTFKQYKIHKFEAFVIDALEQIKKHSSTIRSDSILNSIKNTMIQCQAQLLSIRDLKRIDELCYLYTIDQKKVYKENEYFGFINLQFEKFISSKRLQHQECLKSFEYFHLKYESLKQIQSQQLLIQINYKQKIKVIEQLSELNLDLQESKVQQSNLLMKINNHVNFGLTLDDFVSYKIDKNPSKTDYLIIRCLTNMILRQYHSYSEFISKVSQFYQKFCNSHLMNYNFQDSERSLSEIMKLEVQSYASKKILKWIQYACSLKNEIVEYHKQQLEYQALKYQQESLQSQLDKLDKATMVSEEQQLTLKRTLSHGQCDTQIPSYLKDIPEIGCALEELQLKINNQQSNFDSICLIIDFVKQERFIFQSSQIDLDEFLETLESVDYLTSQLIQDISKRILNSTIYTQTLLPQLKQLVSSQYQYSFDSRSTHVFFTDDYIQFKAVQKLVEIIIPQPSLSIL